MSAPTSGPWKVSDAHGMVETVPDGYTVAIACSLPEKAANARLIAAAPEMLDVLRLLVARLEGECGRAEGRAEEPGYQAELTTLRALITRVVGP